METVDVGDKFEMLMTEFDITVTHQRHQKIPTNPSRVPNFKVFFDIFEWYSKIIRGLVNLPLGNLRVFFDLRRVSGG